MMGLNAMGSGVKAGMRGAQMMGSGLRRFSGYSAGGFSKGGMARMGAGAVGLGALAMHNNSRRGGYKSGYMPKSSGTRGLSPRSTGGSTFA